MDRKEVTKKIYKVTDKQLRQRNLFQAKGKISSMLSICRGLMYDVTLTPYLRDRLHIATWELGEAYNAFNKEVGWKEDDKHES